MNANIGAPRFDRESPMWKCCCNSIHVKTGCLVVGILKLVAVLLELAPTFMMRATWSIAFILIGIAVAVCLFVGYSKESPGWLIPHMVWQILTCVATGIGAIAMLAVAIIGVTAASAAAHDPKEASMYAEIVGGVGFALAALLICSFSFEVWWCVVVFKAYAFFKAVQMNNATHQGPPVYYGQGQAFPAQTFIATESGYPSAHGPHAYGAGAGAPPMYAQPTQPQETGKPAY